MNRQIFEYHPTIGYRFIPNLQTRIQHESGGYLVKTNGVGFRSDQEFVKGKSANTKRILLFGDSYTAADGVSNKKRYSGILTSQLPGVEIYNFGMPGTGTDQQYLIYNEFAKDIEHDLVMIVILVENIRRVTASYRVYLDADGHKVLYQKPFFELREDELILRNTPVAPNPKKAEELPEEDQSKIDTGGRYAGIRRLINKAGIKEVVQKLTRYQPLPEYKENGYSWALMKAIILKWFSELKKPLLLVPLPMHHYIEEMSDYHDVQKRFQELDGIDNLFLYDPIDELKSYPLEERRRFRFEHDEHPSPLGHEAIANALKPKIEELLRGL